jgi:hypothetical protein
VQGGAAVARRASSRIPPRTRVSLRPQARLDEERALAGSVRVRFSPCCGTPGARVHGLHCAKGRSERAGSNRQESEDSSIP